MLKYLIKWSLLNFILSDGWVDSCVDLFFKCLLNWILNCIFKLCMFLLSLSFNLSHIRHFLSINLSHFVWLLRYTSGGSHVILLIIVVSLTGGRLGRGFLRGLVGWDWAFCGGLVSLFLVGAGSRYVRWLLSSRLVISWIKLLTLRDMLIRTTQWRLLSIICVLHPVVIIIAVVLDSDFWLWLGNWDLTIDRG